MAHARPLAFSRLEHRAHRKRRGAASFVGLLATVGAAQLSGCAPYVELGPRAAEPRATPRAESVTAPWYSPLGRHHPLTGRIWSVRDARFIDTPTLIAALSRADVVLLGEKHDNVDHHVLQAAAVRALAAHKPARAPAIAFEMFDTDEQPKIDAVTIHAAAGGGTAALAKAVAWDKKGWPPWFEYAPIAEVAMEWHFPIVAANLPLAEVRAISRQGLGAIEGENSKEARRLGLDEPMPEPLNAALRAELLASHCGHLHSASVESMALAQRARDASMADVLVRALADRAHTGAAVLIAGAGHVRKDRGVPREIARRAPNLSVVSVAFAEVQNGESDPCAYAAAWSSDALPFDYVWFTPRASDEDPCKAFR